MFKPFGLSYLSNILRMLRRQYSQKILRICKHPPIFRNLFMVIDFFFHKVGSDEIDSPETVSIIKEVISHTLKLIWLKIDVLMSVIKSHYLFSLIRIGAELTRHILCDTWPFRKKIHWVLIQLLLFKVTFQNQTWSYLITLSERNWSIIYSLFQPA